MQRNIDSIVLNTDSYKLSHYKQYPKGSQTVYSFFECRKGAAFKEICWFGLQYLLKEHLAGVVVTQEDIEQADQLFRKHFSDPSLFNREGWELIVNEHGGKLPIIIKSVPEGTIVTPGNVLMTVENTDPRLPWLTNYLETLLCQVWYPTTVATQSRAMRKIILSYLEQTGDPKLIDFKLHDFGFRGSTSLESAGIGGAAHLVNFLGTDTVAALIVAQSYYQEEMAGYSIPAAEHSTITSWGEENEALAYANMLEQYPTGLVAVVSDSYDIYLACRELWGGTLREKVLARDGTLVIRPDSGDPPKVVVQVLDILGEQFGFTINDKGYKVLNPKVRVIQGDGIDINMLGEILSFMQIHGWSADNVGFGSGGGLLQKVNRDTLRCAFKCSAIKVDDIWREVMKRPVTDPSKNSKAGRLALVQTDQGFETISEELCLKKGLRDQLVTVFENGELVGETTFAEIRKRARFDECG